MLTRRLFLLSFAALSSMGFWHGSTAPSNPLVLQDGSALTLNDDSVLVLA